MRITNDDSRLPKIGVSRCLLGDAVRYDGAAKPSEIVIGRLAQMFELIAVCPEVEAGLGIPRPPVQLTGSLTTPRMTGRDDAALDVTDALHTLCDRRLPELAELSGFVCKSRSPSCGVGSTPVFIDGECVTESSDGVFVRRLLERYPSLPLIDENGLLDSDRFDAFVERIRNGR